MSTQRHGSGPPQDRAAALAAALAAGDLPRASALTGRFTRGEPRGFALSEDGQRLAFLRAGSPTSPRQGLHAVDLAAEPPVERSWVDPQPDARDLPAAEAARRERLREGGAGIVGFSVDRGLTVAAFALGASVWAAHWPVDGRPSPDLTHVADSGVDPRVSPDGRWVAYGVDGSVWVRELPECGVAAPPPRLLIAGGGEAGHYGVADFIAAEEFQRIRGLWWSPDSRFVLAEGVDDTAVPIRWLADPAFPEHPPRPHRYPQAGTVNPRVWCAYAAVSPQAGGPDAPVVRLDLPDHGGPGAPAEYLISAGWGDLGPGTSSAPLVVATTLTRDQRDLRLWAWPVDGPDRSPREVHRTVSSPWVEIIPGLPRLLADGRVLHTIDDPECDARRLALDGIALTAPGVTVAGLVDASETSALVLIRSGPATGPLALGCELLTVDLIGAAGPGPTDPAPTGPGPAGPGPAHPGAADPGPTGPGPAEVTALRSGGTVVQRRSTLGATQTEVHAIRAGRRYQVASFAARPPVPPATVLDIPGARPGIVLWPRSPAGGAPPWPVVCAPYGGPHARRVLAAGGGYVMDQWLADQGFVVLIADGPGTPASPAAEAAVHGNLLDPPVAGQVHALDALASAHPGLVDLDRVGIHGWSFGGYLAAGALLTRPDRFHAAVAGAPVTDWRRYDTGYSERYLGDPGSSPQAYDVSSLLARVQPGDGPLLLIHGLADDNVLAAHTLQLSAALLRQHRRHEVLPLPGVSHMTPQEEIAEGLIRLTAAFLADALVQHPRRDP